MGWVIFASKPGETLRASQICHIKYPVLLDLSEFWTTESMGVVTESCNASKLSLTETKETRIFENSYRKVADQWMVPYPWREGPNGLPDNRQQAMKRLEATESRLERQISTSKISTSTYLYGRTRRQTDHLTHML